MFCPRCGLSQSEELNFCKTCGANLQAVRQAVGQRQSDAKFDRSNTWVAEMFQSSEEAVRRQQELEKQQGITPEVKRYNEIKAGIITSSVGVALMIFLGIFMQGIIIGGKVPSDTAEILSRVWVAGVIPFFVGLALIFNGIVVSKKMLDAAKRGSRSPSELPGREGDFHALRSPNTTEFVPTNFSVTDDTTKHLSRTERNS